MSSEKVGKEAVMLGLARKASMLSLQSGDWLPGDFSEVLSFMSRFIRKRLRSRASGRIFWRSWNRGQKCPKG